MRQVKSKKNKSTELRLIEIFKENGITGWRRNYPVKGHPDFVFPKKKIAVFVDGCFWHGHDCRNTRPADHQEYLSNLQQFVKLYSAFNNDMDLTKQVTEDEKVLFDWLKKYKLASSEGLNKHTNRMIRYNVMKDFLFGMTDNLVAAADTLYNKMLETSIAPSEDPEE